MAIVLKESSDADAGIHPAQQLAFIEPEANGVIGLTRPRFPCRLLASEHDRQAIQIGDHAAIDGLIKGKQPRLVGEELADSDLPFALLRELGPVSGDSLFVIEPAAGMGDRQGHGGQALGGRVDEHHGAPLPRLACPLVPNTAPEVDDLLAAVVGTARAAQLPALYEVLGKYLAHGLKAPTDVSLYRG